MSRQLADRLERPLRDLRISVTDRCNFRCTYCMPKDVFGREFAFLPHAQLLSFEEIERVARIFVDLGVEKVRITGGEPLLRRDLDVLVSLLAGIEGLRDLTLTTNGSLLTETARRLQAAGLRRITVSLDSLDDEVFRRMNDVDYPVSRVLAGIQSAREAGFERIKVNCVVRRGLNEESILGLAEHFRGTGITLRFIEYMDVGQTNGWRMDDVVPAREIFERIDRRWTLDRLEPDYPGEVAMRFRYRDGRGEIGIIGSVTAPFCGGCTRLRLSSDGKLFTCLFAGVGHDIKALLRGGASDEDLAARFGSIWSAREDRYSELRTEATSTGPRVEMSHIGG